MNNDNLESYRVVYLGMDDKVLKEFDNKMREPIKEIDPDWYSKLGNNNGGIMEQIENSIKSHYEKLTIEQINKFIMDTYWGYVDPKQTEYELIDEC